MSDEQETGGESMTIRRMSCSLLAGSLLLGLLASSAVAAPVRVYVNVPPPPVQVEVRGTAPSPNHVWIGGFHRWDGRAYVWVPGHWNARPHPRAVWVAGRWHTHHKGWYWVDGHWR